MMSGSSDHLVREFTMLNIGIVGFGFMGRMHYRCWNQFPEANVTAICDANPNIIADTQKAQGNIEGAAQEIDFSKLNLYSDFEKMLGDEKLDAVSITLPTHMHPGFTIGALRGGLHVLCEKPMALTLADCDEMIAAAEETGKTLQIGHCIRFWPEYARAKEIIDSGEYGKVLVAAFRRFTAPPTWSWQNWFFDASRSGGMVLDLHIHDADYVQYIFGLPPAVQSRAVAAEGGAVAYIHTHYLYDDNRIVTAEGGWTVTGSFGFEMSFHIMLEKATLVYDCNRDPAFRLCPDQGEAVTPDLPAGDGYAHQIAHFADRILNANTEPVITLEQSRAAIGLIDAENQSVRNDEKITL